jgi:transcriptional regulator with GAF, ATPase, and Fis domain
MISSSVTTTVILDVIIFSLVLIMIAISSSLGFFRKGRLPRTGRFLMIAGVSLTGLFHVADIVLALAGPALLTADLANTLFEAMHHEIQWPVSLISLLLLSSGILIEAYLRGRLEKQVRQAESQVTVAAEHIVESEMRYRSLIEQTPNSMYCFELDPPVPIETAVDEQIARSYEALLVECNDAFARSTSRPFVGQTLGLRLDELHSAYDAESYAQLLRDFIEQGYRLVDYELKYTNRIGDAQALQVSLSGIVRDGQLHRIWGVEQDILEHSRTKAALAGRLHFQQLIASISSQLLTATDSEAERVLLRCLDQVGQNVGAGRASIALFDEHKQQILERFFWSKLGDEPLKEWSQPEFPWLWPKLVRGEPAEISTRSGLSLVARVDAASLADRGIETLVAVPLLVSGAAIGACIFTDIHDRREWSEWSEWSDQELDDLQVIANLFASKLSHVDARTDLREALSELRDAKDRLQAENVYLREEISSSHGFHELVGESEGLLNCLRQVARVAMTNTAVLLQGETGTGKELVARAIHERSERKDRPLVKVNCAALPATLIESELFGHEKGAFTGASARKLGRFDLADGGTLFLDEIADLPVELQSKLLRVLQSGEFERLGGDKTLSVDVRIIAATNRNLLDAVDHGEFRSDLYYRINTFPIHLPALRERGNDIALLAEHFVQKHSAGLGKTVTEISASMMDQLLRYDWPGNVRELEGIVQRALIYSTGPVLQLAKPLQSADETSALSPATAALSVTDLRSMEREHIRRVLEESKWVVTGDSGAATKLGVPPSTLRSKMKKLGISRPN